ncbi:MAG: HAD family phosphatase [Gammaproteobacteria bacterium]|nr:HAD family phosphatase [Gammaproteobacteria bacterium]
MNIKAVLIDHDGTIVDSEFSHYRLWAKVLDPFDISLTETDYKKYYAGMPTLPNAVDMIQRFDMKATREELIENKLKANQAFLAHNPFPLIPGALESIEKLHNHGLKLAIVTGANQHGLSRTVEAYGLDKFVSTFVSSDDVTHSKPAPDCYLLAMEKLGVKAHESVAIEDTEHGMKAAVGAGVKCLAIPTEISEHHNFDTASAVFRDIVTASDWIIDRAV